MKSAGLNYGRKVSLIIENKRGGIEMKKKISTVSLLVLFLIAGGTFMVRELGEQHEIGLPEGYQEPGGRVEKLRIERSVSKYYDDHLDLVAFGPGSGWLKLKTRDGISPTLSFNRVTQKDIQRFNSYSTNIGVPIKVSFSNNILRLSSDKVSDDPTMMADITREKLGAKSIMNTGFFKKDTQTRLVIRKDHSGKVRLVSVDKLKEQPNDKPEGKEVVIAKKEKETAADQDTSLKN